MPQLSEVGLAGRQQVTFVVLIGQADEMIFRTDQSYRTNRRQVFSRSAPAKVSCKWRAVGGSVWQQTYREKNVLT